MEHEYDCYNYQGAELQFVGFDELTSFTELQYEFMISVLRTVKGQTDQLPRYLRAGTNPIGPGVEWVRRRFRFWTYKPGARVDEFDGPYAKSGEALWITRDENTGEESLSSASDPTARSRVFFPATLRDNPALAATDYADQLRQLDPTTRRQLLDGDWMVRVQPGKFLRRAWFKIVEAAPTDVIARCRYWDRAATEQAGRNDPDWTVGVKMSLTLARQFVIEHMVRVRAEPAEVFELVTSTARSDGKQVVQVLEQEPGASGKMEVAHYVRSMPGYDVRVVRPSGDKVARARPLAAQAAPPASNVMVIAAPWNEALLDEFESFPGLGGHDDIVDSASGGMAWLAPQASAKGSTASSSTLRPLARARGGY